MKKINKIWQERCYREGKGRHLHQTQTSVRVLREGSSYRRETALTRLRLGHCALNKTLQMEHQTGLSSGCQGEESLGHVVLKCGIHGTQGDNKELGVEDLILR